MKNLAGLCITEMICYVKQVNWEINVKRKTGQTLVVGILAGSIWGFSEVVLGAFVKSAALPLRGTIMTATGVGILFAAFAFRRKIATAAIAVITTVLIKAICAVYLGGLDSIINSSLAVILEGSAIVLICSVGRPRPISEPWRVRHTSGLAALGIFCAGTLFYVIGNHLAPCPYLISLSPIRFMLHETIPWALFSAATAPLGYFVGIRLKEHSTTEHIAMAPALATTACCWIACAITVVFS